MKLMPASTARSRIACAVASSQPTSCMKDFSSASPKVIVPRQSVETLSPLAPRLRYSIPAMIRHNTTTDMTAFEPEALARGPARWSYPMRARFQDIDAAGIVFYPRFFEYFHDAYVAFLDGRGVLLADAIRENRWKAPLRHVEADYFKPLRFGDPFEVGLVGVVIVGSDVTVGYRVARPDGGELVAVGQTLHTWVDAPTFRRMKALPDDVRRALDPL